jgi:hypothetical protein
MQCNPSAHVAERSPPSELLQILRGKRGQLSFEDCLEISRNLHAARYPDTWCDNPKLYYLLQRIGRPDLFQRFLDDEFTDLWIPLHKQTLRQFLKVDEIKDLMHYQDDCLDEAIPLDLQDRHLSVEDASLLDLEEMEVLGSGGFGVVHRVKNKQTGAFYAKKTIERRRAYSQQLKLMDSFKKEVLGMRRARHRHCVELVASCTDADSVILLCRPVANMDLSTFLNSDLSSLQNGVLRRAVGCITSALVCLHRLQIRSVHSIEL